VPVVDASVIVEVLAPSVPPDAPAIELMEKLSSAQARVIAPALLWLEVSNALLTGIRRRRWDGVAADSAAARLDRLDVRAADSAADRARAFELARRYDNWPVYDMLYVALAERLGTELYTADEKLRARLAHLTWVHGLDD
jgi:predicted nucleic acid-binding protein